MARRADRRPLTPDEIAAAADRAEGKRPKKAGRPTGYQATFAKQAEKLCALGATDIEIADFFEIDVRTLYRWKHSHPEFCQALNVGKASADERVTHSLYQRAIGYEQEAVKIFMPAGAAEPVYAPYREKVAPDVTAAIFWLKNRRPDLWRDKHELEHTGRVALASITDEQLADIAAGRGSGAVEAPGRAKVVN
jgi:uncharacterized protein YjiS (DUF1127 family)